MTDDELIYGTLAGWPPRQPMPNITPDHPAIEDSDYLGTLVKTSARASCTRPISIGNGYEHANPGWRRRWRLPAVYEAIIHVDNLGLVTGSYNGVAAVLVDGALYREFTIPNVVKRHYIKLGFPTAVERDIDLVMPYSASIAHAGITVSGVLPPSTSRLSLPLGIIAGDSRPQGFSATSIVKTFAYLLGVAKNCRIGNLALGSSQLTPSWGTTIGQLNPAFVAMLSDVNELSAGVPAATLEANRESFITNVRAGAPAIKIYNITSTWTNAAGIQDMRDAEAQALVDLANANNVLVDGLSLTTVDDATRFPDNIHANDLGHSESATALAALISL